MGEYIQSGLDRLGFEVSVSRDGRVVAIGAFVAFSHGRTDDLGGGDRLCESC